MRWGYHESSLDPDLNGFEWWNSWDSGLGGIKSRYLSRPAKAYELYVISSWFSIYPDGTIILNFDEDDELLHMNAPLKNVSMLVDHAHRFAGQRKFKQLFCWITHHSERFLKADGEEISLNINVPIGIWVSGPGVEVIRNRWWLMSGVTEFVSSIRH